MLYQNSPIYLSENNFITITNDSLILCLMNPGKNVSKNFKYMLDMSIRDLLLDACDPLGLKNAFSTVTLDTLLPDVTGLTVIVDPH